MIDVHFFNRDHNYVKKSFLFLIALAFLLVLSEPAGTAKAAELPMVSGIEIGPGYLSGQSLQAGTVEVFSGEHSLGKVDVTANQLFDLKFDQMIAASAKLTLKINGNTSVVTYEPINRLDQVNDKRKVVSGTADPNAAISAYAGAAALTLKDFDKNTGEFQFYPSDDLELDSSIKLVSEKNGIKSVSETKVYAAPAPAAPRVNLVSNKDSFITGNAEKNDTVYVEANGRTYEQKLQEDPHFKIFLGNLKAGTVIKIYVVDAQKRKSSTVFLTVADKMEPDQPKISPITDKSFSMTGSAEPGTTVYIQRNSRFYKSLKVPASGKFEVLFPLQLKGTVFAIYAVDASKNKSTTAMVKVSSKFRPGKRVLNAPLIRQMPELPRGCEVTSLAMLLNYNGIHVSKMTLAKKIKKDPTPFRIKNGKRYFGNPNDGFVGNMYTFSKPGFGVFNKPIEELAKQYMTNRIINLTGSSFETILNYVGAGHPVWIITTSWFSYVPGRYWETWYTPHGTVRITMKEHSVLVTGYDGKYVYINDPLYGSKNRKLLKAPFIEGWEQYGRQAISYY